MAELTARAPRSSSMSVRKVASLGMLCAIAYVVMWISKTAFAPIVVGGFLTFDLKDTIIAIAGFIFGPLSALIVSVVVSLIEMVTHSETGPVGLLMNVLSTAAFVCPAAFLYKRRHTFRWAVSGLVIGAVAMTFGIVLWNLVFTTLYLHVPREVVATMLPTVFLPFNLVKAVMNSALTIVLYKPVVTALRKARLAPEHGAQGSGEARTSKKSWAGITIVGVFILVTGILLALVLAEKI